MQKKLVIVCLINFLIAALMGLALRYSALYPININYRFLTHAHSHVAMLGWIYLMLYVLIVHYFICDKQPIYTQLFWITQFAVIGMMLSFPFQGYAIVSISFSTLHIFCSYYFIYLVWKHHKTESIASRYLLRSSLLFMLFSTIGVWCLGPAVSMLGQASSFYQIAIQFFIHFQFNGWFFIAVIAVFFHIIQIKDSKTFHLFFKLLIVSTILTLALPVSWFAYHEILIWMNGIGVILQIITLILFIKLIKTNLHTYLENSSKITRLTYDFALFCLALKIGLQTLSLIPEVADMTYQYRHLVIGFIHLTMLGVISGFLFAFILQSQLVKNNKFLRLGIYVFVLGFILSELMLTIQGSMFFFGNSILDNYHLLLFLFSMLLPLGILGVIFNISRHKQD